MPIEQTPSWTAAQEAKEAWRIAFADKTMNAVAKATKRETYARLMMRCQREADGVAVR